MDNIQDREFRASLLFSFLTKMWISPVPKDKQCEECGLFNR